MNLSSALANGELLHPVDSSFPNTVDLFRALALASGDVAILDLPGTTDHVVPLARTIGSPEHIVMVLADGLGVELIERHLPPESSLRTNLSRELRAVYPSTTAVALTSVAGAAWPAEHGMTGWWTRFPELGRTLAILPFVEQVTGTPGARFGVSAGDLILTQPVWGRSLRQVRVVLPREITPGSYNQWFETGISRALRKPQQRVPALVDRLLRRARRPSLIYVYLPVVDSVAHQYGPESEEARRAVVSIENTFDEITARARRATGGEVTVLLTADHGHTTTPKEHNILIDAGDPIMDLFSAPPSGDVRSAQLWLKDGANGDGLAPVEESLARIVEATPAPHPRFLIAPTEEVIESGLLGPAPVTDRVRERWGEATLVALDDLSLEYTAPGVTPHRHLGSHSGLAAAEMRVPLVTA